jgi:hypothetical protein
MRTRGNQSWWLLVLAAASCVAPRGDRRVVPANAAPVTAVAVVDAAPLAEPQSPTLQPVIALPAPPPSPAPATEPAPKPQPPVVHALEPSMPAATIEVVVGQELVFANCDTICHGLFSSSVPNAFDVGMLQPGARASVRFTHAGTVRVYCSLHQHQKLTVQVLPLGTVLPAAPGR